MFEKTMGTSSQFSNKGKSTENPEVIDDDDDAPMTMMIDTTKSKKQKQMESEML